MIRLISLTCLSAALLSAAGCTSSRSEDRSNDASDEATVVLATTGMVADLVRGVAGDELVVVQLLGAGVDPHLYKPTRDDVQKILSADAVFYSGLMLEGKMADVLSKVAASRPVFAVTDGVSKERLLEPDGAGGHPDPHVWMDVALWGEGVALVERELSRLWPMHAETFVTNARSYREELARLDGYARESIATIPEESRVLVTSHDAFGYFGRAYGLEVFGVQGVSTESEAALRRVSELVTLLVERRVPAVFVESSVPAKSIEALIDGAAAQGHSVTVGAELFSDAMGAPGTVEGTYVGMIDHNVTRVVRALGGTAPERGLTGRLAGEAAP